MTFNALEILAAGFLGAALLLGLIRLLIGPDPADRVIAADTMSVTLTASLTVFAAFFGSALYLDVALVYGAVAFISVIAIARVIESTGQ